MTPLLTQAGMVDAAEYRKRKLIEDEHFGRFIDFADMWLDRYSGNFQLRGGQLVELTRNETRLAEVLLRNAPRVVAKDVLRARIWGDAPDVVFTNKLEVLVNQLRKKIGEKLIETVRSEGYRMTAGWPDVA